MKLAFMTVGGGRVISQEVGSNVDPTAFVTGDTYKLAYDLPVADGLVVPSRSLFEVEDHDHSNGIVTLRASVFQPSLSHMGWGQCIMLQPYATEDLIGSFVHVPKNQTRRYVEVYTRRMAIAATVAVAIFAIASFEAMEAAASRLLSPVTTTTTDIKRSG